MADLALTQQLADVPLLSAPPAGGVLGDRLVQRTSRSEVRGGRARATEEVWHTTRWYERPALER